MSARRRKHTMAQPIWKGHISFGLVSIPVAVRPAEARDELDLDLLDRRDHSLIGYRKVNKKTGKEVSPQDIVRGYQYAPGRYVVLTDADLRRASVERTQRIDILSFCQDGEINPMYFERPYYLEAAPKNEKAYALLRDVLDRTHRIGVARLVLRTRQYAAALLPLDKVLVLNLLRFPAELREPGEIKAPGKGLKSLGVSEAELKMAQRLVEEMTRPWDPSALRDEYRDELLGFIKKKATKGEVEDVAAAPRPQQEGGKVLDMMSLLKRSLEQTDAARRKPARRKRA